MKNIFSRFSYEILLELINRIFLDVNQTLAKQVIKMEKQKRKYKDI